MIKSTSNNLTSNEFKPKKYILLNLNLRLKVKCFKWNNTYKLNSDNNIGYFDYKTKDFTMTEFELENTSDSSILETRRNFTLIKNNIYEIDKFTQNDQESVYIYTIEGEFYVKYNKKTYLVCKYFDNYSPIVSNFKL